MQRGLQAPSRSGSPGATEGGSGSGGGGGSGASGKPYLDWRSSLALLAVRAALVLPFDASGSVCSSGGRSRVLRARAMEGRREGPTSITHAGTAAIHRAADRASRRANQAARHRVGTGAHLRCPPASAIAGSDRTDGVGGGTGLCFIPCMSPPRWQGASSSVASAALVFALLCFL